MFSAVVDPALRTRILSIADEVGPSGNLSFMRLREDARVFGIDWDRREVTECLTDDDIRHYERLSDDNNRQTYAFTARELAL